MKEIKIQIPEGYEGIDEEKSNFTEGKIVFKKKEVTPWIKESHTIYGYFVNNAAEIQRWDAGNNHELSSRNIFATKKQAKSMRAMAQLSQIIQNDPRFGGPLTDEEWLDCDIYKYIIDRCDSDIKAYDWISCAFRFLAFHTQEQRDLFMEENMDLIRQYYMLD